MSNEILDANLDENASIEDIQAALEKIDSLKAALAKKLEEARLEKREQAIAEVLQAMEDKDVTIEELAEALDVEIVRPTQRRAKVAAKKEPRQPPKYQNPANPAETWSGRGTEPAWATAYRTTAKGVNPRLYKHEILIKP